MPFLVAKDILTPTAIMLPEDMLLFEAAGTLRSKRICGAPVADKNGAMVGIITVTDIFSFIQGLREKARQDSGMTREEIVELRLKTRIRDVMTRNVRTAKLDTPLNDIFDLMIGKNIHTIPVVADDGKDVIGVIGRHDLGIAYLMGQTDI